MHEDGDQDREGAKKLLVPVGCSISSLKSLIARKRLFDDVLFPRDISALYTNQQRRLDTSERVDELDGHLVLLVTRAHRRHRHRHPASSIACKPSEREILITPAPVTASSEQTPLLASHHFASKIKWL